MSVYTHNVDSAGGRLRGVRLAAGLSIRELAERAGVAVSTVWRIESGRLDPTVGMFNRLVAAARPASTVSPVDTREGVVSLALGRLTASAVLRDPDRLVARAHARVVAILADEHSGRGARRWALEWQRLLEGPLEDVVAALIDPGECGYEFRQNMPFAGMLSDGERLAVVRRASREHRAARSA